jgi:hypothetical protein
VIGGEEENDQMAQRFIEKQGRKLRCCAQQACMAHNKIISQNTHDMQILNASAEKVIIKVVDMLINLI